MIAGIDEVLKANLVLVGVRLIGTEDQKANFDKRINVDTIESSPAPGAILNIQSESGPIDLVPKTLTLGRDRIKLDLMPDRTAISIEYPDGDDDLNKLASIARTAIEVSDVGNQVLRAFGFNLEVVYKLTDGEQAGEFIARSMFAPGLFESAGFQIVAGSPKLVLHKNGQLWNIGIEPRFGKADSNKIFATINLHYEYTKGGNGVGLGHSAIHNSLMNVWEEAHAIVEGL